MTEPDDASRSPEPGTDQEGSWAVVALESLAEGVIVVDDRGRFRYQNSAAARLVAADRVLAGPPEAWPGTFGIFTADGAPLPPEQVPLFRALQGEHVRDVELLVKNPFVPAGVYISVTGSPLLGPSGQRLGAMVIFRDVSKRREREALFRDGARQREAILQNLPDSAWLKDRSGRYLAVNHIFVATSKYDSAAEVVGLTDFDLFPAEIAERYRAEDDEVTRSGKQKLFVQPFIDREGTHRWVETIKAPIFGDNGAVLGTTGVARDITERKEAEEALHRANDELERRVEDRTNELARAQQILVRQERLAVLGQLAGGVAHQIRNPLAAIMNAAYVLQRHVPPRLHPDVDDAMRIILDEVRHANVIITGLLDFARVREPDRQPGSIVEVIERVLAAERIPDDVVVRERFDEIAPLEIDADQLQGAIANIVRNAIEAMPDGGTLTICAHETETDVIVSIEDTGGGIPAPVRGRLFEPLHSTKPLGVGLGLVTARTFVEAHGGRIVAGDGPTSGARFEIHLPRSGTSPRPLAAPQE